MGWGIQAAAHASMPPCMLIHETHALPYRIYGRGIGVKLHGDLKEAWHMGQLDTQTLDCCAWLQLLETFMGFYDLWDSFGFLILWIPSRACNHSCCSKGFASNCTSCSFPLRPLFRCAQDRLGQTLYARLDQAETVELFL